MVQHYMIAISKRNIYKKRKKKTLSTKRFLIAGRKARKIEEKLFGVEREREKENEK